MASAHHGRSWALAEVSPGSDGLRHGSFLTLMAATGAVLGVRRAFTRIGQAFCPSTGRRLPRRSCSWTLSRRPWTRRPGVPEAQTTLRRPMATWWMWISQSRPQRCRHRLCERHVAQQAREATNARGGGTVECALLLFHGIAMEIAWKFQRFLEFPRPGGGDLRELV